MIPVVKQLEASGGWDAQRRALADLLGLDEPVDDAVLGRVRADERYATYLIRSRDHIGIRDRLLASAGNARHAAPDTPTPSTAALLGKLGVATARWAASGFKRVDDETYARRFAACESCPHLKDPPKKLAYSVPLIARSDPRICGACGCVASRKASLATERCPVRDPARPGSTLWGEPMAATA